MNELKSKETKKNEKKLLKENNLSKGRDKFSSELRLQQH